MSQMPKITVELYAVGLYGLLLTGRGGRPLYFPLLGCVYNVCQTVCFEGQGVPTDTASTKTVSERMKRIKQSLVHGTMSRTC
jgi:hypothetical protein